MPEEHRRRGDLERIAVLEVRVSDHEEDLRQMFKHQEVLSNGVAGINATLRKILYFCVGAGSIIVIQEVGLLEVIIKLLT